MRKRLFESREELKNRETLRTIRGNIEDLFWLLGNSSGVALDFGDCLITINVEDTIVVEGKLYARVVGDSLG